MKKISLYIMSILTLGFMAACTEDFNEGILPQTNEPEQPQSYEGLVVEVGKDFKDALDLSTKAVADTLHIITTKVTPELNKYSTINYVLEISNTEKFDKKVELEASTGFVLVDNLNTAYRSLFGKSPKQKDMYTRFRAYVVEDGARVRCGEYMGASIVKLTPIPLDIPVIEPTYYLVGDITGGWDDNHLLKLSHSDVDVYDDPVFVVTFESPKDNAFFKIVPESAIATVATDKGLLGCEVEGSTDLQGKIISSNPKSMKIEKKQWVRVSLNIMDMKYTITLLGEISPYLWIPGNQSGWSEAFTKPAGLFSAKMDMKYSGFTYLDGDFKLTAQADWSPMEYNFSSFLTKSDNIIAGGESNMKISEAGFYQLVADITANSIVATKVAWGIIGDATSGSWDTDTALEYDKATNCWSVTTNLKSGNLKFRANNSWDINVGGSISKLVSGGDNIAITDAGNYTIKLYLSNDDASYCTVTKN